MYIHDDCRRIARLRRFVGGAKLSPYSQHTSDLKRKKRRARFFECKYTSDFLSSSQFPRKNVERSSRAACSYVLALIKPRYRAPVPRQILIVFFVKVGKKERGCRPPRGLQPRRQELVLFGYTSFRNCSFCSCHNANEFSERSMWEVFPRLQISSIQKLR